MRLLYAALLAFLLLSCSPPNGQWIASTVTKEKKAPTYTLKLQYPRLQGASDAFNNTLEQSALIHLEQVEDDPIPFEEYEKNIAVESAGQQWAFESVMAIANQNPSTVTTICKTYTNTGAAHPNVFHYYEVYDRASGRRLELNDLLEPGKLPALQTMAKSKGDEPNEPQIGLLPDHLVFRADPDARMVEDVAIPYAQLKGILKTQYIP